MMFPYDSRIIQSNLEHNLAEMKNNSLMNGNEAWKETKDKMRSVLTSIQQNQVKTIKESSMRMLLKDYVYFTTDLCKELFLEFEFISTSL